jgi:hypothetical protein
MQNIILAISIVFLVVCYFSPFEVVLEDEQE